jgi:hypothetical protein
LDAVSVEHDGVSAFVAADSDFATTGGKDSSCQCCSCNEDENGFFH